MCFLGGPFSYSVGRHDNFRVEKSSFVSDKWEPKVLKTDVLNGKRGLCGARLVARQFKKKRQKKYAMLARFLSDNIFRGWGRAGLNGILLSLLSLVTNSR